MQTSVETGMAIGLPGQIADLAFFDIVSRVNGSKQLVEVTITAADLETTLTINTTPFTVNAGGGVMTKAEIATALKTAINAGSEPVTASDGSGTDKIYVRADVHGTAFTATGTANCSVADKVLNEETICFGKMVTEDTWTDLNLTAHLPSLSAEITTAGLVAGVTVHTQALEQAASNAVGYAADSAMSVMRKGRIYVAVEDAVTKGGTPYVRYTANGSFTIGSFRSDDDSSKAAALPCARYARAAAAGGITVLELNLP
jgi:hypothetical protein